MPVEAITDDQASARYGAAVEAWGERGWAKVASLCRWAVANGAALPFDCPR